jgi:N-acylneuraminate cytidylyltransferase
MNNIVAIIPARSGSKGVPDKNIKNIHGNPLIAYSIKAAIKASMIDRVIVSTDSQVYAKIAKDCGAEVPFIRPSNISQDESTDIEFFKHAIDWLDKNEGKVPNYFVHLRPTTPLRDPDVIDQAIRIFIKSNYSSLRSIHKMSESAYKAFEVKKGVIYRMCGKNTDLDRSNLGRQKYPVTYNANGYVDVIRTSLITNHNKLHGSNVHAFLTNLVYEIDEISDINFVEYMLKINKNMVDRLFKK